MWWETGVEAGRVREADRELVSGSVATIQPFPDGAFCLLL